MSFILALLLMFGLTACDIQMSEPTANQRDTQQAARQQSQYGKGQPVPSFNWSLERDLVIQLYKVRNQKAATHSVWRSDWGTIEGDCASYGYGIPYDTSLTNPLVATDRDIEGDEHDDAYGHALASVEQPEPNGVYASKNTAATWVMCLNKGGSVEPVYVETKVTVYPGPVKVDYETNRVVRFGKAAVTIKK